MNIRITRIALARQSIVICLAAAQLLLAGRSHANQYDMIAIDTTQLSLEELMDARIARVVSVSRHEQRITEAPASVTVITADDIKRYGYRTLADIMRSVPGLYVSYDRNYSYLGVRGFSRPGDYNSRVLLLIDGHRMNDNIYDTAAIGTEFPLDIGLIDHIEFTRGPGSSLYGSNAFFGMINVFTRKGEDVSREFSASAGSYETWKGRASYGAHYESGLEVLMSGSLYSSNGQRNISYPEYPDTSYWNNDYDKYQAFYSRFSYGDFTLSGLYHSREKGIPTGAFETAFNTKPNYTRDNRGYADLSYKHGIGDVGSISTRLYYDGYYSLGKFTWGEPAIHNTGKADGHWWGMETVISLNPLRGHHVSLGGEFRGNLRTTQTNYDDVAPYLPNMPNDNHRSINWGVFVQDEYQVFKPLLLSAGVRYDSFDHFHSINPRASLIYQPTATTTLKLIYGEAFRAPNIFERFYTDGGVSVVANPDLKPEKIRTYEAVWEQYFGTGYNMSLAGFYNRIDNLISQDAYSPDGTVVINRNIGKADARGIDLSLQAKWENGLQGRLSYTWQEAKNLDTGALQIYSPRHLAKANVSLPLYKTAVIISPELQYVGQQVTNHGNRTRDVVLTNLTLLGSDLIKGLDMSASVYNLFDVAYGDPVGNSFLQDTIRQDGINFRLTLTYRF